MMSAASTSVISDPPILVTVSSSSVAVAAGEIEIQFVKCDCCGLTEECTQRYIDRIRERYQGKWICGLCAEAVKDEIVRTERLISTEEALTRHMNFLHKSSGPPLSDPTVHLIEAMRQILRRTLESPRSMPNSPINNNKPRGTTIDRPLLTRSESCMPSLSLDDSSSSSS
ncbi:uncharacterized protein LOC124945799 [Impatiens glandulifera]|uniref:uncharacterized protein LOC124945799 n=1 Tax=Impatiens glandulifera TaxID=253017 RepID=UPI001FB0E307|nr:uncharacterized protein LOC124945799 [Impatiens glandulifera]XP_047342254.1 uncharacterized protein LOC124945799 [Impatiens glandulifera]